MRGRAFDFFGYFLETPAQGSQIAFSLLLAGFVATQIEQLQGQLTGMTQQIEQRTAELSAAERAPKAGPPIYTASAP